jgi:hypothetical protein
MRWPNRRLFGALLGAILSIALSSCSDDNGDSVGTACKVIVQSCNAGASMGDCIDAVGGLSQECLDCIGASQKCGYGSCQRLFGCRIPVDLIK